MADQLEPPTKKSRSVAEVSETETEMMMETQKEEYIDDDYEYDSIDEEEWGSKENMIRYYTQIRESGGFDLDDFSYCGLMGMILAQPQTDEIREYYKKYAIFAIKEYNRMENTNFQFEFLEKVNVRASNFDELYLTFRAVDPDGSGTRTFQALVGENETRLLRDKPDVFLEFCRLKDTTKQGFSACSTSPIGSLSAAESNRSSIAESSGCASPLDSSNIARGSGSD